MKATTQRANNRNYIIYSAKNRNYIISSVNNRNYNEKHKIQKKILKTKNKKKSKSCKT